MEASPNEPTATPGAPLAAHWLGRVGYRDAWDLQKRLAAARAADRIGDRLLLLEHPAVLTLGRGADEGHVLAPASLLEERGIELLRVERGGEVTYHGPGQLVAYPIVRLADRGLLLRPFVRALEGALSDTCAAFGVTAGRREGHPGCWVTPDGPLPRKIGALGLRVERGVTYHGIALNVSVDLADFALIDPCGMPGLTSASIVSELGRRDEPPSTASVARASTVFAEALASRLATTLEGALPPDADPVAERAALERLLGANMAGVP
ncbi:MAG: lipoyl(octanoyl) transferase LipB [Chloroflexi bacterium]|nr:lipoyl(octanoyl) transferase LipB [Chloroflexota bacterium]